MTSVLIFLSLCLHVITLTIVFRLFKRVQSLQQNNAREVTDVFEEYLQAIKHENRQLEHALAKKDNEMHSTSEKEDPEQMNIQEEAGNSYAPETNRVTDETALSLEARVLQLFDKGSRIEEIARELNCGCTEAELIIKMNQRDYDNA